MNSFDGFNFGFKSWWIKDDSLAVKFEDEIIIIDSDIKTLLPEGVKRNGSNKKFHDLSFTYFVYTMRDTCSK